MHIEDTGKDLTPYMALQDLKHSWFFVQSSFMVVTVNASMQLVPQILHMYSKLSANTVLLVESWLESK